MKNRFIDRNFTRTKKSTYKYLLENFPYLENTNVMRWGNCDSDKREEAGS